MSVALSGAAYWLPLISTGVIVLAVAMYVVLDGFDLGIGILFPCFESETQRDQLMSSIAPFWDGNETWLVLGGTALLAGFPLAYSLILPALYMPVILMLLALVFRGVAFEFRTVAKPHHKVWDLAFTCGSVAAALAQGLILGALLEGIPVANGEFAGRPFGWLSPFGLLCAGALLVGYALLGACWIIMKTSGEAEHRARALARPLLIALMLCIAAVSVWTPLEFARVAARWFAWPNLLYLAPVPLITLALAVSVWRGLAGRHVSRAFYSAVGIFVLAFFGLVISTVPYLVPPAITLWQAAAAPASQAFMLAGEAVLIPVTLAYTVFVYRTFRGRVRPGEGYHH